MLKFEETSAITAYVALGSNLGDREANLRSAIDRLDQLDKTRLVATSSFLDNPAIGGPADSPAFLNACVKIETCLSAGELLANLFRIEQTLGRRRRDKWEPRPIDLDLLLYGNDILHEESLTVPHPLMHQRRFVLQPLAEIAPEVVHPGLNKTVSELLQTL